MKDKIARILKGFKLDALGIMKLYIAIQGLADALKLSSAEKKRRAEMALGYIAAAHILRCWRDDARYADFRESLGGEDLDYVGALADDAQAAAVNLLTP